MKKVMIVSLALLGLSPTAYAGLIFDFSFSSATGEQVNGRILGLVDNTANQAATSILIDSFTAQTAGVFGTATNDVTTWSILHANAFSVAAGQIVQSRFAAQDRNASLGTFCINLNGCLGSTSFLRLQSAGINIGNSGGFGGVQFTNTTSVAEPATVGLFGLGLVGLVALRRRRRAS